MLQNHMLARHVLIDIDLDSRMLHLLNLTRNVIGLDLDLGLGLLLLVMGTCLLITSFLG